MRPTPARRTRGGVPALTVVAVLAVVVGAEVHARPQAAQPSQQEATAAQPGQQEATAAQPGQQEATAARGPHLRIADVRPMDPSPGTSVRIRFATPLATAPQVLLDGRPAAVLRHVGDTLVVEIPADAPEGIAEVEIRAGRQQRQLLLRVRHVQRRKLLRNILGGLALFLLGLRSLAQGLRSAVGQRDRRLLAGVTRSPARALGFGAMLGALTQSTASSAAVLIGLGQARMVSARAGVWVLVGAYCGTVVTASLLPLAATREALFVVALGTLALLLSPGRRARGLAVVLVAFGMLALGLRYIQAGFQPLLGDPELMAFMRSLSTGGFSGHCKAALLGALFAALLQGPGPVFALVLGLAQSSGAIGLPTALSLLSGAAFGSALGVGVLSLPYGPSMRGFRRGFVAFGLGAMLLQLLTLPLWQWLADRAVAGAPGAVEYGKKELLPHMGEHLSVGFVASQFASVAVFALVSLLWRRRAVPAPAPEVERRASVALSAGPALADALSATARVVEAAARAGLTHDASAGAAAERALLEVRATLEEVGAVLASPSPDPAADGQHALRPAWLGLEHLRHACEALLRDVQVAMADDRRLPAGVAPSIEAMAALLHERFGALDRHLRRGEAPDMRAGQAAEIRLNAMEADVRQRLLSDPAMPLLVLGASGMGQLPAGLEQVGNHLFRLTATLAQDPQGELL